MKQLTWTTEKRKVKDLVPYEFNPRKLSEEKKALLKKSLSKFNLAEIPAINTDNIIIAGHQRIIVLLELGRGDEVIDVRVPSRALTEDEFKEYNLRSNVQVGDWDIDVLTENFEHLDLDSIGLNIDDIDIPDNPDLDNLLPESENDFDTDPPIDPITKDGDVYEFVSIKKGLRHYVVCGDSTEEGSYELLDSSFDLIITDPPYNVNYEGGTKDKLKIQNDNMSQSDFYDFLYAFYSLAMKYAKEGAPIYVFHADSEGSNFRRALVDSGFKFSESLVWVKNHFVMGRQDYHWKHEPILYGWKLGAAHPWYSDRCQSTVVEFDKPLRNADHPTMKPIELIEYFIENSSKRFDVVADPFSGSGSTLIACEKSIRNCRAIELEPRYTDVNVKRWVTYMKDNNLEYEVYKNGIILSDENIIKYLN